MCHVFACFGFALFAFQVVDHMLFFPGTTFAQAFAEISQCGLGSEWRGDLVKTEHESLVVASPTYRRVVASFDSDGPQRQVCTSCLCVHSICCSAVVPTGAV